MVIHSATRHATHVRCFATQARVNNRGVSNLKIWKLQPLHDAGSFYSYLHAEGELLFFACGSYGCLHEYRAACMMNEVFSGIMMGVTEVSSVSWSFNNLCKNERHFVFPQSAIKSYPSRGIPPPPLRPAHHRFLDTRRHRSDSLPPLQSLPSVLHDRGHSLLRSCPVLPSKQKCMIRLSSPIPISQSSTT